MSRSQSFIVLALLVIAGMAVGFALSKHRTPHTGVVTVYYTRSDGKSEVPWTVSMRAQRPGEDAAAYQRNRVAYAATQAIAGPPSTLPAVRFPPGTHVVSADVKDSTATVDLSSEVRSNADVLSESGEFKSLVWTLTALPGIDRVDVRVEGRQVATLPGGHLELDEPLRRSDW